MTKNSLDKFYTDVVDFLDESKIQYLIIGGLAVSVIGEPRMTNDIDIIVSIKKQNIQHILKNAKKCGWTVNIDRELQRIKETGTFRLNSEFFHLDVIIASTLLEEKAFARAQKIKLGNRIASFPSPEDLILFKIIVGRDKDILDARSIVIRHKNHLDYQYLEKWAQSISDEAEDISIWNRLKKVFEDK